MYKNGSLKLLIKSTQEFRAMYFDEYFPILLLLFYLNFIRVIVNFNFSKLNVVNQL